MPPLSYKKAKEFMNETDKDRIISLYFALMAHGTKLTGPVYEQAAIDMDSTRRSTEVMLSGMWKKLRANDCYFDEGKVAEPDATLPTPKKTPVKKRKADIDGEGSDGKGISKRARGKKVDDVKQASVKVEENEVVDEVDDEV